ncbi:hypothetical protein PR048_007839 [Dryococelus australis]|uniref:Uncharacterized protein n=1 Tax=Dryococelus australis TaxID=614101 RepID=A0ABQ9HVD4_9NEOP|nr:hypothetical protein PR048_007839 [Dryococelus australis]
MMIFYVSHRGNAAQQDNMKTACNFNHSHGEERREKQRSNKAIVISPPSLRGLVSLLPWRDWFMRQPAVREGLWVRVPGEARGLLERCSIHGRSESVFCRTRDSSRAGWFSRGFTVSLTTAFRCTSSVLQAGRGRNANDAGCPQPYVLACMTSCMARRRTDPLQCCTRHSEPPVGRTGCRCEFAYVTVAYLQALIACRANRRSPACHATCCAHSLPPQAAEPSRELDGAEPRPASCCAAAFREMPSEQCCFRFPRDNKHVPLLKPVLPVNIPIRNTFPIFSHRITGDMSKEENAECVRTPAVANVLSGRRIVDIVHLFTQIQNEKHHGGTDCSYMDVDFVNEKVNGFHCTWIFKCRVCNIVSEIMS